MKVIQLSLVRLLAYLMSLLRMSEPDKYVRLALPLPLLHRNVHISICDTDPQARPRLVIGKKTSRGTLLRLCVFETGYAKRHVPCSQASLGFALVDVPSREHVAVNKCEYTIGRLREKAENAVEGRTEVLICDLAMMRLSMLQNSNTTAPLIDDCHAAVVYIHLLPGRPCDREVCMHARVIGMWCST